MTQGVIFSKKLVASQIYDFLDTELRKRGYLYRYEVRYTENLVPHPPKKNQFKQEDGVGTGNSSSSQAKGKSKGMGRRYY